ncbi:MAG: hypothetical protein IJ632_00835 [Muribaculaceae bacterium]|nr:hypothetical protein [Muribaculaceae bacterium]
MNGCRNIVPVIAGVVAALLALAACGHSGMTEQTARAAVDTVEAHYKAYITTDNIPIGCLLSATFAPKNKTQTTRCGNDIKIKIVTADNQRINNDVI